MTKRALKFRFLVYINVYSSFADRESKYFTAQAWSGFTLGAFLTPADVKS